MLEALPLLAPVLPDSGVPLQLVHHDDVATAIRAAVLGRGKAGTYNLAGAGTLTLKDIARELGWHSLPVPRRAVDVAAEVIGRAPLPPEAAWIDALRKPVLMDTAKARRELAWRPAHTSHATLRETVEGARAAGIL
jgi:nucleoside-diphosphate-sugar epimerase